MLNVDESTRRQNPEQHNRHSYTSGDVSETLQSVTEYVIL
jgi:hypothetical protein